jgi:diadenosine tetraphosphate (Ap4A) HIT family hydrolase
MQEVFHVHLHVVPRYVGDGFTFQVRAGHSEKPTRDELERVGADIRSHL